MTLYTDGTTEATIDEVRAALAALEKAEAFAGSTAVADVEAYIAADPKLAAAGITVAQDQKDPTWVEITFPTDSAPPLFWAGVSAQFAKAGGAVSTYTARVGAGKATGTLLAELAAVL